MNILNTSACTGRNINSNVINDFMDKFHDCIMCSHHGQSETQGESLLGLFNSLYSRPTHGAALESLLSLSGLFKF